MVARKINFHMLCEFRRIGCYCLHVMTLSFELELVDGVRHFMYRCIIFQNMIAKSIRSFIMIITISNN